MENEHEHKGWLWATGLVLMGLLVWWVGWGEKGGFSFPNTAGSSVASSSNAVKVSIASSITKREWLEESIKLFNDASRNDQNKQVDGRPVHVEVLLEQATGAHYRSPTQVKDTLSRLIQPVMLSPADEYWLRWLNDEWRQKEKREIITEPWTSVAQTPVVVAMWESRAKALGCWPLATPQCTWGRLRELAVHPGGWGMLGQPQWGRFKFGYAYVGESDVGTQTAMLQCMTAAGSSGTLAMKQVEPDEPCGKAIASLERAAVHRGKVSPWLLGWMREGGPEYLDAATTYEKEVLSFNLKKDGLREPLVSVYPQDGTVVAGHSVAILSGAPWVTQEQTRAAQLFRDFLKSDDRQRALPASGMRPANPDAALGGIIDAGHGAITDKTVVKPVNVPDKLVMDQVTQVWHRVKKHVSLVMLFDKSGSMQGAPMTGAVKGAEAFVESMEPHDELCFMPFDQNTYPCEPQVKSQIESQLLSRIRSSTASGGTALYDAVAQAYGILENKRRLLGDSFRFGIVILSDGEDNDSKSYTLAKLEALLRPSEHDPTGIQIHAIGLGVNEATKKILARIAESAHGRYWEAKQPSQVLELYREIAAYY